MALFETTALALDSARRHAGPAGCCAFAYTRSGLQTRERSFKTNSKLKPWFRKGPVTLPLECLLDAPLARFSAEVFQDVPSVLLLMTDYIFCLLCLFSLLSYIPVSLRLVIATVQHLNNEMSVLSDFSSDLGVSKKRNFRLSSNRAEQINL